MSLLRLLLLLAAVPAWAVDQPPIKSAMDYQPRQITIGDRVKVTFRITAPLALDLSPPSGATCFGDWEILGYQALPSRDAGGGQLERAYEYTLTAWTPGKVTLPAIAFSWTTTGRRKGVFRTEPAAIQVDSVLAREKDPKEMRPPKGFIGFRSVWPWIWAGLAVLSVAALIWWWRRRRIRAEAAAGGAPAVPARPPEETAREALEELAASGLAESGEIKLFYIRLSDIVRRYIEGRFGISALDRTTAELLPEIRRNPALSRLAPEIRNFFEDCDLAKFAKYIPKPEDITTDLAHARRVVDETARRASTGAPQ